MSKTETVKKTKQVGSKEQRLKDATKEIKARNRYFYIYNRYGIIMASLLGIMLIVNIGIAIYFQNQTVPPRYVPVDNEMRYFPPTPLNKHDKSDSDIQTFVMSSLKELLAYDYINYNEQLMAKQDLFTSDGWIDFANNMKQSFILDTVQENKWISSFRNTNLPKIVKRGINPDGIAYWLVEIDGVNSFVGENKSRNDNVTIRLKIERVSTLMKENGIGIASFIYINNTNK